MKDKKWFVKVTASFIVTAPDREEALACADQVMEDHYPRSSIEWIAEYEGEKTKDK